MLQKYKIITLMAAVAFIQPQSLLAQDENVERRVEKLEKEVRAVQRVVFPSGSDRFFEPEIVPEKAPTNNNQNSTDNAAVRDLLGRVNALEEQLATLTGQMEQQQFNMRSVETRLADLEKGLAEQKAAAPVETASAAATSQAAPQAASSQAAASQAASAQSTPAAKPVSSARRDAVAAIEIPSTGNEFEDSYNYGFRLWDAKFYPEAQVQLQETVDKFPNHPRVSFARNLLGRAWLDDNKPTNATKILYDNYINDPRGGRAPDSLYFLGQALTNMSELSKACEAYQQLEDAYPDIAEGRLANRLSAGRSAANCS